jgi:alpha-galactosidase/6-phospho-beta-glucosidase family protein
VTTIVFLGAGSVVFTQTIGDTIGIGGIFRGLRRFPVLAGMP